MFIQTEATENPEVLKFLPGRPVVAPGSADFPDAQSTGRSPLARRLFEIDSVQRVFLGPDYIAVTKAPDVAWAVIKPAVLGSIMDHFVAGDPVVLEEEPEASAEEPGEDGEVAAKIRELIETRIRPTAQQAGGDVTFRGYENGVVIVEMQGAAHSLKQGIETMLRHYVPEVEAVKDYRDAMPKPGLNTPEGETIRRLLDEDVNPSVAAHGGHISLVDVRDDTAYIRLEGGCQGCGMADVTLKQGVETAIKRLVPSITSVLDVTDHAGGSNPYYQPGKDGMSAL
jgi:Fe-S cluster biogenesis protein NfuA